MSVLSHQEIKELCEDPAKFTGGKPLIENHIEANIRTAGYDLRLGGSFYLHTEEELKDGRLEIQHLGRSTPSRPRSPPSRRSFRPCARAHHESRTEDRSCGDLAPPLGEVMRRVAAFTGGGLLVQTLEDYRAGRASTALSLAGLRLTNTRCRPGDVRDFLPEEFFPVLDLFLARLEALCPGLDAPGDGPLRSGHRVVDGPHRAPRRLDGDLGAGPLRLR